MYRVSDEQIEFILDDIKKRGVETEDLQLNLLDHVCCIIEREYNETDDFNTIYNTTIKQFFKTELWEIEEETIGLLHFKHYYKMKRFLYIILVLSVGYNVFVFSRLGYKYYQMQKQQNEWERIKNVSFQDGLKDFELKMKEQYPKLPIKDFTYITFADNFFPYFDDYEMNAEDSMIYKTRISSHMLQLKRHDSLAAIYNNVNFVYAYQGPGEKIDNVIYENVAHAQNIIFIKDVPKLLQGYGNFKKRSGFSYPTTFLVNKSGNILYESSISISFIDKKLIKILNETR